ncbi:MAG: hypothetical protein QOD11_3534 [Bradyrhizobium sp.]|nr:hypothetical protein [Bradyrhizobium sp.]
MEAQSKLYASQVRLNDALRALLAKHEQPTPNYEAWRHVHELNLRQAAFLWCDIEPRMSSPPEVTAWTKALEAAIKKAELSFVPKFSEYGSHGDQYKQQMEGAWHETVVTRDQLRAFAKAHGYDPIFLRDA